MYLFQHKENRKKNTKRNEMRTKKWHLLMMVNVFTQKKNKIQKRKFTFIQGLKRD
jgi:hypothetical protein